VAGIQAVNHLQVAVVEVVCKEWVVELPAFPQDMEGS
jgi:hypothetical protein